MTCKKLGGLLMFISYYFSRKSDLRLPFPQIFEKTFTHENKYQKMYLNTSTDN